MTYQRIGVTIETIEHHADRLIALCDVFSTYLMEPVVEGGCPLMNTAVDADDTEPILRDAVRRAMTYLDAIINTIVDEGKSEGNIRPDVDGKALATIMIAILEGALMMSKLYDDDTHLEQAHAHLALHINTFVRADSCEATKDIL
jgi:TetR/AcrR family transcriptional repressor of nem operon